MNTRAERLQHALLLKGWSGRRLAREASERARDGEKKVPEGVVSKLLNGQQTSRHWPLLARTLDVSHEWLVTGSGTVTPVTDIGTVPARSDDAEDDDLYLFQWSDPRFEHGPNAGNAAVALLPMIGFHRTALTRNGLRPEDCCGAMVATDVPSARLVAGDAVVIHVAETRLERSPERVFALVDEHGELYFRRVSMTLGGDVKLVASAEEVDVVPAEKAETLVVAGRVRHFGGDL